MPNMGDGSGFKIHLITKAINPTVKITLNIFVTALKNNSRYTDFVYLRNSEFITVLSNIL